MGLREDTRMHEGALLSPHRMAAAVLVQCEHCGVLGPKTRYAAHLHYDHKDAPPPQPYDIRLPGRFRKVLERMEQTTKRTPQAMVTAALDEWLHGREPFGMRRKVYEHTHWGADE